MCNLPLLRGKDFNTPLCLSLTWCLFVNRELEGSSVPLPWTMNSKAFFRESPSVSRTGSSKNRVSTALWFFPKVGTCLCDARR